MGIKCTYGENICKLNFTHTDYAVEVAKTYLISSENCVTFFRSISLVVNSIISSI